MTRKSLARPCRSSRRYLMLIVLAGLGMLVPATSIRAGVVTFNFETNPVHAKGPSTFTAAGAAETLQLGTLGSISGGVVLGDPTFLASFAAEGSPPNAYGTAFFGSPTLQPNLTITFKAPYVVTSVEVTLFNGLSRKADYDVCAGAVGGGDCTVLNQVEVNNDPAGFRRFTLTADGITSIEFTPDSNQEFDYLIDNVVVTFATPEPAGPTLVALGAATLFVSSRLGRRRRQPARGVTR